MRPYQPTVKNQLRPMELHRSAVPALNAGLCYYKYDILAFGKEAEVKDKAKPFTGGDR
jgi:hypothetical protein